MVAFTNWQAAEMDPLVLQLDALNPRIEGSGLTQDQIRELLLRSEDVDTIAWSIVHVGGLYPHDRIIVTEEAGKYIVLEGNRRTCAAQFLLKPNLIPADYKKRLPSKVDETVIDSLRLVEVLIAPSRQEADPIIARIHALPSRRQWQPLAKHRYAHSHFQKTNDIDEVAQRLSVNPSSVRRFIRRYKIYRYALSLPWTASQRGRLSREDIPITSLIYPFENSSVRELIGEVFDSQGEPSSGYKKSIVRSSIKKLARDSLLPNAQGGYEVNTRTDLNSYFKTQHPKLIADWKRVSKENKGKAQEKKQSPGVPPKVGKKAPIPAKFFEDFSHSCSIHRIVKLGDEIVRIQYRKTPIAAGMLLRALLETTLYEHIKKIGKLSAFKAKHGKEGLKSMVLYCSDTANGTFKNPAIAKQLARFQNSAVKGLR